MSHVPPSFQTATWIKAALPLSFASLFTLYFPELNIILVGTFLPDADVAVYNACLRTAFLIAFGLIAVDSVILPRISYLYEKRETQQLQRMISRSTLLKVFGASLALAVLALAGKKILGLFGPDFVRGYPILLLLGLAQLVRAIGGIAAELLAVTGHQNRCLPVFGSALVATVVLNGLLVPAFGLMGAAASIFIVIALSTIWLNALVLRHLGIAPSIFAIKIPRQDPSCQKSSQ
jgi:O-antigen/teichoic acid export membrane protein